MAVFWGDACEEFVEGVFGFLLGFEHEGSVSDLKGDFAIGGHGDGVGDRAGDGEREMARVVRCELDAIPVLGGFTIGQGLNHRIYSHFVQLVITSYNQL